MFSVQQFSMNPGMGITPYIDHMGIVPETKQDANNLVQLGEIQGLIISIEKILAGKLAGSGEMTQRYARELINKLQIINQYRWDSGNDPSGGPKMIVPGKNRALYITESPHSILTKARQFVGMYSDLSNDRSNWNQMSPDEKKVIQRQYGKFYREPLPSSVVMGDITGGQVPRMPLNGGGKYNMQDLSGVW
jgi:hypothetical protein